VISDTKHRQPENNTLLANRFIMTANQKVDKINELEKKRENWKEFAYKMQELIKDENRSRRNYRSLLHHIRVFFGVYKEQFELVIINNEVGLLQLNFDYAMAEVEKLDKAILDL